MKKIYYFPNSGRCDAFFWDSDYSCFDEAELRRLAVGWDMEYEELLKQVHEASEAEIAEYGTYDGE